MTTVRLLLVFIFSAALALTLDAIRVTAQEIPKQEYLRFVPLEVPRLVRQTPASSRLNLYGDPADPAYRDVAPLDGIDDERERVLRKLAVRFSPFMVMNTTAVPFDWRAFAQAQAFPLYIDTWNTAVPGSALINEETIDMLSVRTDPCTPEEIRVGRSRKDDCRLLELLEEFDPERPGSATERTAAVETKYVPFKVLYFDFPGADPSSWNAEYRDPHTGRLPVRYQPFVKSYVHPFLLDVSDPHLGSGYEFVLQYWFFYPWNDGGNNHKGDWEHINVVISPRHAVTRALRRDEVAGLLDGEGLDPVIADDEIVIKRVDYYFHSKVMALDYASPNVYLPREVWEAELKTKLKERIDEDWFWRQIRLRAYQDDEEARINTHPVAYIGADNKGTDQLFALPGGTNRDSHGTFPFPALYKDVGPANAAEVIGKLFDHKKFYAASSEKQVETLHKWKPGGVVWLADPGRIEIVPDYERVIDLVKTNPEARAGWSWLVLPLRWGYPAVNSPFAGVVAHAETGNLSAVGPAFNSGWNQSGATRQYAEYSPHRIPRLFPLGWVDGFQSSWGFLNLTLPTLTVLPPFDLLWRVVAAPVRLVFGPRAPTLYPADRIPFRFIGLSSGVSTQTISEDFIELGFNADQFNEFAVAVIEFILEKGQPENGQVTDSVIATRSFADNATAPFYMLSFFIGDRFASDNMLRNSRSQLGLTLVFGKIQETFDLRGELNLWEYAGSLRFNIFTGNLQPYAKLGYGLSWYRLENLQFNDQLAPTPNSPLFRELTWHVGGGFDFIIIKSYSSLPRGIDLSLRTEWVYYTHKLGLGPEDLDLLTFVLIGVEAEDLPTNRRIGRHEFKLGLTLSY